MIWHAIAQWAAIAQTLTFRPPVSAIDTQLRPWSADACNFGRFSVSQSQLSLGMSAPARQPQETNWDNINRTKFVTSGVLLFGTASTLLYPLSVAKTRLQTYETGSLLGALRRLVQQDGVRGLYRGYSVAILGTLPVRVAYLSVLEATRTKLRAQTLPPSWEVPDSARIWAADFTAGSLSSLMSQAFVVPVDVVSQRMQVEGAAGSSHMQRSSAFAVVRAILREDGPRGLYRGAGASLIIYSGSSGIWWGCYGLYQRMLWSVYPMIAGDTEAEVGVRQVIPVQMGAAMLSGVTSGVITTPLDVVKTRLQTFTTPGERPTFRSIAAELFRTEGLAGFTRGMQARVTSTMVWSTAMTSIFEFLKRISAKEGTAAR